MKKSILLIFMLLGSLNAQTIAISGYLDGGLTGGLPKALELYAIENIADLSVYTLELYSNGGTTASSATLPAVAISAGHYYYLVYTGSVDELALCFGSSGDFANVSVMTQVNSNGDDVLRLVLTATPTTVVDVLGELGVDGTGTAWEYLDTYVISKNTRTPSGTFNAADWNFAAINSTDGKDAAWHGTNVPFGTAVPLPVELTSFTAKQTKAGVMLNWTTATEVNNFGFDIEALRATSKKWEKVGFVEGHGNSNSPKEYSFFDNSGATSYRLKQVDFNGNYEYSDVVTVSSVITKTELYQNSPNPFNPSTKISFSLAETGKVNVSVYNVIGQKVADLVNQTMESGVHNVDFNASNLPSGLYIYRLETPNYSKTMKMMLIK